MKTSKDFKAIINNDFFVSEAENHLDVWKERYYRKSKEDVFSDLNVNHDPSLEIERAEELLGRNLTDEEYDYVVDTFNKTVKRIYYK